MTYILYDKIQYNTIQYNIVDRGLNHSYTAYCLQVLSQNEAIPSWLAFTPPYGGSGSPYAILENVAIGTSIASAAASDADDGVDGVIKFRLDSTTTGMLISIPIGLFLVPASAPPLE